ncbi:MAG: two-component regulator propeller domain-containing protein [Bacteroidota bacterium]|nr:two-component regulator propeller domain-containing protein [Bacteroidota bacterium]
MRYALATIVQCICLLTGAQNSSSHFTTFTSRDGLSNSSINCLIKDSRNFIWIGTAEGLNRFDGSRFLSFFSYYDDPASLSGNNIFDILQYQPGRLLIATNNGLSVFNTFTNSFENYKISVPELRRGCGNFIRSLFKDKQGRVYVNYSGVIDVFNDTLSFLYRFTDLPWAQSLRGVLINKEPWFQDSQNRIWLPTDNKGICLIDENKQQVYSSVNNPMGYPFMKQHAAIRSFLYDEQGQVVWYSIWGAGLERYDLKKKENRQQLFNIPDENEARCINSITKEKNGNLVCGGGQAIYRVDPETLRYTVINENFDANSRLGFLGSSILNDTAHIWIGTETNGLMQLPGGESYIQQIPLPSPIRDYTNFCTGIICSENQQIYMAYGLDGLLEINPGTLLIHNYTFLNEQGRPGSVSRICEDKKGRLWIGGTKGFFWFDKTGKRIIRADWLPSFTQNLNVSYMLCDTKGNVWISFRLPNSLGFYNASENKFHYYENYRINNQAVFDTQSAISRMTEDEKGNIWMTSYGKGEIACYEYSSGQWKSYPRSSKKSRLIADNGLNSICPAGGNEVWLSNDIGVGLAKYNYSNDSISFVTRRDGLLSDNISSISRDSRNNLFLVSKAGINLFTPSTKEIRTLKLNDQNINLSFAYQQFYDSIHHQLLYGLNDRILLIKDGIWESVANNQVSWIDNITVNNRPVHIDVRLQKLSLRYFEKNIAINFASPSYAENSSLSYAYKLEGADNDWITAPQAPRANYTNLSPGRYRFLVKTRNQTGKWGPVNNSLLIIIAPPFWRTWWFISAVFVLIGLSVYWLFRRRVNTIHHEAQMKQTIAETEMMALRAQMNPHFIFNCLNAIDNLIQTNQKEKATTYLAKFAKLIRNVLDSSKNNVVPFQHDYESLQLYLQMEQFRCNNKFTYELSADEELLHSDYKLPPLIVQPFVENAIHHGLLNKRTGNRKLTVSATLENDTIKYTVIDNGVGRLRAQEIKEINKPGYQSYGIAITTERIHLYNQNGRSNDFSITDLSENGGPAGTKVEIRLKNYNNK